MVEELKPHENLGKTQKLTNKLVTDHIRNQNRLTMLQYEQISKLKAEINARFEELEAIFTQKIAQLEKQLCLKQDQEQDKMEVPNSSD